MKLNSGVKWLDFCGDCFGVVEDPAERYVDWWKRCHKLGGGGKHVPLLFNSDLISECFSTSVARALITT